MLRQNNRIRMFSTVIAIMTFMSLGCVSFADENNEITVSDSNIKSSAADNSAEPGWNKISEGCWKYYEDGKFVTGWKKIGNKWFCFGSDEYMITGLYYDSGYDGTFLFGTDGAMLTGWQLYSGRWYYLLESGRAVSGWKFISGKWYFFDRSEDPYMYQNEILNDDGASYLLGTNGEMLTGWQYYNDKWYYFERTSGRALNGWQLIGGKWYYFDNCTDPYAVTGLMLYKSKCYYFDPQTCSMNCNGWALVNFPGTSDVGNSLWCYFGSDGAAYTGWKNIDGNTYYFGDGTNEPYMRKNFIYLGEKLYYFGNNGVLRHGWFTYDNKYFYSVADGSVFCDGWITIDGDTFFFEKSGRMYTGMWKIDNILYDFGRNGVCKNPPQDFDTDGMQL